MKKTILLCTLLLCSCPLFAQKYLTRIAQVIFDASTPLENIHGINNEAAAIIDLSTGNIVFQVLIRSFHLEKALMQEHFNEDYMESSKYPKADFKGKIINAQQINPTKDGSYKVQVQGSLRIHGVTKTILLPAEITLRNGKLSVQATLTIKPADYQIEIPSLVRDKIAKEVQITVNGRLRET